MLFKSVNKALSIMGAAIMALTASAHADRMYSLVENDKITIYVNYALVTGANYHYGDILNSPMAGAAFTDLRTHAVDFSAGAGTGFCWEVETQMTGNSSAADTRIWYKSPSGVFTSLNDDINGSNLGSRVRVWAYNTAFDILVLPYETGSNDRDFYMTITKKTGLSEANCTTSSGLPWIKRISLGSVTFGNNS